MAATSSACSATGASAPARDGEPLFDLDLTYKVQPEAGGIAQVVAMAERFAAGDKIVVCLGDNIFEYAEVDEIREFAENRTGAKIFLKEVPDPERFGVPLRRQRRIVDIFEKPVRLDKRFTIPRAYAVVGLYCFDADVYDIIRTLNRASATSTRSPTSTGLHGARTTVLQLRDRLVEGRRHPRGAEPDRQPDRADRRQPRAAARRPSRGGPTAQKR